MDLIQKAKETGLIFDGGTGSMLFREGLSGKPSEYWNFERPEVVEKIHRAYINAGSDVVSTNTFGGSQIKLKKTELGSKVKEVNQNAAMIARKAAGNDHWVAGDIGPTGEMLQPFGLMSTEEATETFTLQASWLAEAGVNLFIIETMFDLNEALAAIRGIRQISNLPIFATLTFEQKPTGFVTLMGNRMAKSMKALLDSGADAVGANCSIGSDKMVQLAKEIRESVESLVIIQPNAGIPKNENGVIVYPEDAEFFSENIKKIKDFGVEIVGGCCGTTPDYIRLVCEKNKLPRRKHRRII